MSEKINQYEAMFLAPPAGGAELEKLIGLCRGIIEKHGGQIILIRKWDERKLAYEIEGHKRGTYILSFFRAPPTAVAGIERDVKLSEELLRVLVLRADHLTEKEMAAMEPQPVVRDERSSHDRGGEGGRSRHRREEQPAEQPAARETT